MSEEKVCCVCGNKLHITHFANGHDSLRCMNCEKKHPIQDNNNK